MTTPKDKISVVIAADCFTSTSKDLEKNFNSKLALVKLPSKCILSTSIDSLLSWNKCGKIFILSKEQNILDQAKSETVETPFFHDENIIIEFHKLPKHTKNYGDVLRYVDGRDLEGEAISKQLGDDFIFVQGPYFKVCNNVIQAFKAHKSVLDQAKKCGFEPQMTFLFKESKDIDKSNCFLFGECNNPKLNNKICKFVNKFEAAKKLAENQLKYDTASGLSAGDASSASQTEAKASCQDLSDFYKHELISKNYAEIPTEAFSGNISHKNSKISFTTRTDLVESHIYILNLAVLSQFTEFPVYSDFYEPLNIWITAEDTFSQTGHYFIGKDIELEPLDGLHNFRRILQRRFLTQNSCYDGSTVSNSNFTHRDGNTYVHHNTNISSKSFLFVGSYISNGVTIRSNTRLSASLLMENCKIGKNCILDNCYIGDNVKIGNHCKMRNCFIASNTVIAENSTFLGKVIKDIDLLAGNLSDSDDDSWADGDDQKNSDAEDSGTNEPMAQEIEQVVELLEKYPTIRVNLSEISRNRSRLTSASISEFDGERSETGDNAYFCGSDSDSFSDCEDCGNRVDKCECDNQGGWSDQDEIMQDTKEIKNAMKNMKDIIQKKWKENEVDNDNFLAELRTLRSSFNNISFRDIVRLLPRTFIHYFSIDQIKSKLNSVIHQAMVHFTENKVDDLENLILKGISEHTLQHDDEDQILKASYVLEKLFTLFEDYEKIVKWYGKNKQLHDEKRWVAFKTQVEKMAEDSEEESSESEGSDSSSGEEESSSEEEISEAVSSD